MKKYSVIVPVYKVEKYLTKCVDSVLNQNTTSEFEVILVDDGSPDRCGSICDKYEQQDNRVKVVHQENKGISCARNTGLNLATGEYILYLDSDDYWEKNLLLEIDNLLQKKPDIVIFNYSRVSEAGIKETKLLSYIPNGENGEQYLQSVYEKNIIPLPFVWVRVYRREFLLNNNLFFNEALSIEDYDYTMRALPLARSVCGTNQSLYNYVIREDSITSNWNERKIMDSLMVKTRVFKQFPTTAVANDYAWFVLMAERNLGDKKKEILKYIKNNREVFFKANHPTLRISQVLVRLFGFSVGIKLFYFLHKIKKYAVNIVLN